MKRWRKGRKRLKGRREILDQGRGATKKKKSESQRGKKKRKKKLPQAAGLAPADWLPRGSQSARLRASLSLRLPAAAAPSFPFLSSSPRLDRRGAKKKRLRRRGAGVGRDCRGAEKKRFGGGGGGGALYLSLFFPLSLPGGRERKKTKPVSFIFFLFSSPLLQGKSAAVAPLLLDLRQQSGRRRNRLNHRHQRQLLEGQQQETREGRRDGGA